MSWEIDQAQREAKRLREAIEYFEKESGLSVTRWDLGRIGDAVRALTALPDPKHWADRIAEAARELQVAAECVRAVKIPPLAIPGATIPPEPASPAVPAPPQSPAVGDAAHVESEEP